METFNTIDEIKDIQPCCVALGNIFENAYSLS